MVAIDTNIIVRFLTRDDEPQYEAAFRLIEMNEIFIPDTVILETESVLRFAYEFGPSEICDAFTRLFGLKNVHLSNAHAILNAIEWHRTGIDFSDAVHLALSEHCDELFTFDQGFVKQAGSLTTCAVTAL